MQIKGEVKAKARTGKSIKVGEDWYSVRNPSDLGTVDKGMMIQFEYSQNGDFKNIDPKTLRVAKSDAPTQSAPKPAYSSLGVELGHAANLAMQICIAQQGSETTLEEWENHTKEIFERMKDLRLELEQGGGHFGRELKGEAKPTEELDDDIPF